MTSLSHDIYSNRPKTNIIIKLSLCVIHVLQCFYNKDQFVQVYIYIRDSKMEGVPGQVEQLSKCGGRSTSFEV